MARRIRSHKLETRTQRLALKARKKPYYVKLAEGLHLGYRRNQTAGTWSMRVADGKGSSWLKAIGAADDFENTPGAMDFWAASTKARELLHGSTGHDNAKLVTVQEAVAEWKTDLETRGGEISNATRVEGHLAGTTLADKVVATLTTRELKAWKVGLLKKGLTPSAVTRNCKSLSAALSLAASHDARVKNRDSWRHGLASLPGSTNARNVILPDEVVRKIVAEAVHEGERFQEFVEVLAVTGCRPSQARRLLVADLLRDKLLVPRSRKGRNKRRGERETRPVPIPISLGAKLRHMAEGRPANAPLLLTDDGKRWGKYDHRWPIHRTAERCELDPTEVTIYALRHSSIVRQLLKGVPVAIVADSHDTSERQIRAHYAKYISDHSDALTRAAMLDLTVPPAGNVVPMAR